MDRADLETTVMDAMVYLWDTERNLIRNDSLLGKDLDADSLDLVELVMELEDRLHIEIPDNEFDGRVCDITVADVCDLLAKHA